MASRTRSSEREPRPEDLQYASYWDRRYEIDQEDAAAAAAAKPSTATHSGSSESGPATQPEQADLPDYDWFRSFEAVRPFLTKYMPPSHGPESSFPDPRILHLGCGNSTLPSDLHSLGYHNQVAVDFSRICIEAMRHKYAGLTPPVAWEFADVRDMAQQFPDASFDVAIDKGTLDAMLHGSLWDPPESVRESVGKYTDEVARVLKPGSVWLYVTYRQPHFMRPLLDKEGVWTTTCETLSGEAGAFEYFGWLMKKLE